MVILGNTAATIIFLFGIIWLWLPGGFGVLHFNEGQPKIVSMAVSTLWVVFMLIHALAIYRIWFSDDKTYIWLIALFLGQVLFFTTIATDVSTR